MELNPQTEHDHRGFWIGLPYQRQGYVTEAVVASTDYAFNILKMPLLALTNAAENIASQKIKVRAGAELVGTIISTFVCGDLPKQTGHLMPERWAASSMKRAAANPSYNLIG